MKRLLFRRNTIVAISSLLVVLIVSFIIPQFIVRAATITVDSTIYPGVNGDGNCSLDEAVANANANGDTSGGDCAAGTGQDDIVFDPAVTAITMTTAVTMTDATDTIRGGETVTLTAGGGAANAIVVQADGIIVSGFTIQGFTGGAIRVEGGADGVQIGETTATGTNILISNGAGVVVDGATNTIITNNIIGFDSEDPQGAGVTCSATGNSGSAIFLQNNADGTIIDSNVLACNAGSGVFILDAAADVEITNNSIGLDISNTAQLGNGGNGITGNNVTDIIIEDNFIDNNTIGISLTNTTCTDSTSTTICNINNNTIGTVTNGTTGNRSHGIVFNDVEGFDIEDNIIRDNVGDGILLTNNSDINDIFNNLIDNNANGVTISGSDDTDVFGNTIQNNDGDGVAITNGSTGVVFNGGSIITNGGDGISTDGSGVTGVDVDNSNVLIIFNNVGLGIDLDDNGVSGGSPTDNGGVQFPDLTNPAYTDGSSTAGTIDTSALTAGTYEFYIYSNSICDGSGFGEGENFIEFQTVTIPPGITEYTIGSAVGPSISFFAVNTTTGNVSEFSQCVPVVPIVANFTAIPNPVLTGANVTFTNTSTTGADLTYDWDMGDGTTFLNQPYAPFNYAYGAAGIYTVELCVNGPGGLQVCTTVDVEVTDIPTDTPTPTNTPVPDTSVPDTSVPDTPVPTSTFTDIPTVTGTLSPVPSLTSTDIPTITPLPSETGTVTLAPTITPFVSETSTVVPSATLDATTTATVAAATGTARSLAAATLRASLTPPTLVYFAQASAPIRQCVARDGLLLCVEIDPNRPFDQNVTVTLEDGTVVQGGAFEPFVIKFARPAQLLPGGILTYTIQVVNPTDSALRNVRVTDIMPAAITIIDSSATSGSLSVDGQAISFSQVSLAANSNITITITGRIRDDRVFEADELDNRACLASSGNTSEQCATFGFSPGTGIGSGETPFVFSILKQILLIVVSVAGITLFGGALRLWMLTKKQR